MGTVFPRQSDNMKLFAVLALAAVAFAEPEAEADPALLYGAYGYGLPYSGVYGYRTYGAYPYSYSYYGKRSAEAEADPILLPTISIPQTTAAIDYQTHGTYPYTYGYYGKRSADAEPEADAEADPALLYHTYRYGLPYSGVYRYRTYGAPLVPLTFGPPAVGYKEEKLPPQPFGVADDYSKAKVYLEGRIQTIYAPYNVQPYRRSYNPYLTAYKLF